jgi:hypothetical protein
MPQVNIHCVGNHLCSWFFEILDFWEPDARHALIDAHHALFLDERCVLVRRVALLPNGQCALIRCIAFFSYGKHVGT